MKPLIQRARIALANYYIQRVRKKTAPLRQEGFSKIKQGKLEHEELQRERSGVFRLLKDHYIPLSVQEEAALGDRSRDHQFEGHKLVAKANTERRAGVKIARFIRGKKNNQS